VLKRSGKETTQYIANIRDQPITNLFPGNALYVDIRCYGVEWYDTLLTFLPDRFSKIYVVEYYVTHVYTTTLCATCSLLDEVWNHKSGINALNSYWLFAWAHRSFADDKMVLVTAQMCLEFPVLISQDVKKQKALLQKLFPNMKF
jgi:hypothetical protein